MSIIERYEQAVLQHHIEDDPTQRQVAAELQKLADSLSKKRSWFSKLRKEPIDGLYLYGPVGVGKTFLMDLFYQSLDYQYKSRFHFHQFMQQIDMELRRLQGEKNPLQKIAADFAKSTKLLCFDEFLVQDVAHAMILAELLQSLLVRGVVFVMTSNTQPDNLYLHGVQRKRFLPAIALIKQHCNVLHLQLQKDYRMGKTPVLEAYLYPLNAKTQGKMEQQFHSLAPEAKEKGILKIQKRDIPYLFCSAKAVWFAFDVICNLPRSQLDYLEIADRFDTVFISNVPKLTEKDTAAVILLIHLIDVLYDKGTQLILSAEVSLDELYQKGEMKKSFKRTLSRLHEMQSQDYLKRYPKRDDNRL